MQFWMNTCEVIHQWREKAVLLFVPDKFDFQGDLWQDVEHYTLQQAHITVLLIMQLTVKTQLILQDVIHMSITKWTVVAVRYFWNILLRTNIILYNILWKGVYYVLHWPRTPTNTKLLLVPEKFDFQCDLWQDVEHYTLQQAHITVLLILQLTVKTQLI